MATHIPESPDPRATDVEADEADLAEQRRSLDEDEPTTTTPHVLDEEADEGDLLEQELEVGESDEDYPPT
jgi:hypothetical protein